MNNSSKNKITVRAMMVAMGPAGLAPRPLQENEISESLPYVESNGHFVIECRGETSQKIFSLEDVAKGIMAIQTDFPETYMDPDMHRDLADPITKVMENNSVAPAFSI